MDSVRLLLVAGVGGGSDCLPTTYLNFKITDEKIKTQKSWDTVPLTFNDFVVQWLARKVSVSQANLLNKFCSDAAVPT